MTERALQDKITGPYRPVRLLGEGGAARTWLAVDTRNDARRAIKELQLLKTSQSKQIELFERECATLKELQHPQIPRFIETIVERREETMSLYLVQECIEGRSLQQLLDSGITFEAREVVAILRSCLVPLAYLHARTPPLFHRDLKPSNILLRHDGHCVLVDFGAVREALADPKAGGSSVVGTFGYMAPEQFQARAFHSTDLYALGATAIHLLTGIEPARFEVRRLKPDFHERIKADSHLVAILDLLLEPAAEDRYQRVEQLVAALERWQKRHNETQEPHEVLAPIIHKALQQPEPATRTGRSSVSALVMLANASTVTPDAAPGAATPAPAQPIETTPPQITPTPAAPAPASEAQPAPAATATATTTAAPAGKANRNGNAAGKGRNRNGKKQAQTPATGAASARPAPRTRPTTVPVVNRSVPITEALMPGGLGANAAGLLVLLCGGLLLGWGFLGNVAYNAAAWKLSGLLLALWGLLLVVVPRRKLGVHDASLRQEGLATTPQVTAIERLRSPFGQTEWVVAYEYRGDDALHYQNRQRLPDARTARQLADDPSGAMVRFDPNDPSLSVLLMQVGEPG